MAKRKHNCTITHGGKVISNGSNKDTCFLVGSQSFRMHAECDAIRRLPHRYRSRSIDITVSREDMGESKPCEQCIRYMKQLPLKIRNITYSTREGVYKTEKLKDITNDHMTVYHRAMLAKTMVIK